MAKLARATGGFFTSSSAPEMIGQMQILDVVDVQAAGCACSKTGCNFGAGRPESDPVIAKSAAKYGGGARDVQVRLASQPSAGIWYCT